MRFISIVLFSPPISIPKQKYSLVLIRAVGGLDAQFWHRAGPRWGWVVTLWGRLLLLGCCVFLFDKLENFIVCFISCMPSVRFNPLKPVLVYPAWEITINGSFFGQNSKFSALMSFSISTSTFEFFELVFSDRVFLSKGHIMLHIATERVLIRFLLRDNLCVVAAKDLNK